VRATHPGLLDGLPGEPEPPEDARQSPAGISLVVDDAGKKVRNLPCVYVNTTQVYAHRDVDVAKSKLHEVVDVFVRSGETPAYMLTACEIDGRRGLYGTDFYNRSQYRLGLRRLGMRFSDHPFVFFDGDRTFRADDLGAFTPSFVAMGRRSDNPSGTVETGGALLLYHLAYYRIADIGARELSALARLLPEVEALSATEPEDLAAALRAEPA
jgi:hypothetical protein